MEKISKSPEETLEIARNIANNLPDGGTICLYGELGAGKTVFCKGFAEALGIEQKAIKSPTFTILREYKLEKGQKLYHYDFYRQSEPDQILIQSLEEHDKDGNYILIEWPERIEDFLNEQRVEVRIKAGTNQSERIISVKTHA